MISINYNKGLPLEFESFLIHRYNSFMTTCRYIELFCTKVDICNLLVSKDGKLIELLIFGINDDTATCFNSLVQIDEMIVSECTMKLFDVNPTVKKIRIGGSYSRYNLRNSFTLSKANDYILELPDTLDDYYLKLGSATRKNIKKHNSRLQKHLPEIKFVTKYGAEIEKEFVDKILQLNHDRMMYKGIIPGKNSSEKAAIYNYSKYYGCVAYFELNGEIVAGCISTILNKKLFMQVIGHDNNFSQYDVGQLCIFYMIKTSIESKLNTVHFLWGDNDYKMRFSAKAHQLESYFIYRTFSFNYLVTRLKAVVGNLILIFRQSELMKPIRNAIKEYRRKSWKIAVK